MLSKKFVEGLVLSDICLYIFLSKKFRVDKLATVLNPY